MIMEGLRKWEQPFDLFDLDSIEKGRFKPDSAIRYLTIWQSENPEDFHYLEQFREPVNVKPINVVKRSLLIKLDEHPSIKLLPEDRGYIVKLLQKANDDVNAILDKYIDVWMEAEQQQQNEALKESTARRAANGWLRQHITGGL
jgi:hypothetical protein